MEHVQQDATLEERKLKLENDKLALEQRKLEVEREKAKWAALGTMVPVVVALATIAYGIYSLRQTAIDQFESKAAELALAAPDAEQAKNRARILAALYGDLLPTDFAKRLATFQPSQYGTLLDEGTIASKKEVFQAVTSHPGQREQIVQTWGTLFPDDRWINELKQAK